MPPSKHVGNNKKKDQDLKKERRKRSRCEENDSSDGEDGGDICRHTSSPGESSRDGASGNVTTAKTLSPATVVAIVPSASANDPKLPGRVRSLGVSNGVQSPPPPSAVVFAVANALSKGAAAEAAAADKAAAKRARADALLGRLTDKLEATKDPSKRLALQAKMLRILPKCTPPQPMPAATKAAPGGMSATPSGGAPETSGGFVFKLQRTPKSAATLNLSAAAVTAGGPADEARRRLRQQRFSHAAEEGSDAAAADAVLVESGGVGTSAALEKEYLRLTSLPRASDVRPPGVLAAALRLVKAKWLQRADYAAASEQLKSIRQDLTVQHVRDALTVDVYETHGRLALEADDLAEFRRCHGVLRQLYGEGLPGNPAEFEAYGLLYTQATAAARNTLALELGRVPRELLSHPFVRHAMDVCAAARSGNYARFVALYDGAPRMSPYIMDRLLGQMRLWALQSCVAAHKPLPVPLELLAAVTGLETEEEAATLAQEQGAVVDWAARCLDTRASASKTLGPPRPPA
ncbi:hypothetical protein Agub_g13531 [Astrephomene gubernaculifera]|uniref:SAC3/GANP/THP3 conserved domain-containing protein n=1 Tax=Astrephomene gubernaculifera TaxID=47775 RepID=A0AAD3E2L5_9CHLO|nr:hypothetical protein Agub_g13531 [Astrephomene gubernaculifera]